MTSTKMERNQNQNEQQRGLNRKARLIVRNLSFKTTEKKLRDYFGKFGDIEEINMLRRPDGKLKGCAFVQYKAVQMAARALYNTTGKPFLEREIVTDWAVAKDRYVQTLVPEVKEEILSDSEEVKPNLDEIEIKEENVEEKQETDDSTSDKPDKSVVDESEEEKDEKISVITSIKDEKRPKVISNDVSEGKTVFIKNVPFTATNEDLKQCMLQFGRVFYALICKDRFTEHSKGTAFVKFVEKESAEQCLEAGTELKLLGNILDCYPAMNKNTVTQKFNEKQVKNKDSRNLYLIKEGVILAGSPAAKGLSKSDMEKRLKLEQWKTQILKNLHMFVSQNRLVVHNVPESWDDSRLKKLFLKHGGPKVEITESRIMRDMKNLDNNGVGRSKGYGFVSFTKHENAIHALRSLNNNPNIFTPGSRPIVAFSIENKLMVNAKHKRLEKSKQKNPLCKQYTPEDNVESSKAGVKRKYPFNEDTKPKMAAENKKDFAGIAAKPGMSKLRSKFKLRTQAKVHHENMKKDKNLKRKQKRLLNQKQPLRQPKQKMNKRKEGADDFSKLVNKYKSTLTPSIVKKSKWYE